MSWTICKNETCAKANECQRFINQEGIEINFAVICTESNNYQWFWQNDLEIIKTEENLEGNKENDA